MRSHGHGNCCHQLNPSGLACLTAATPPSPLTDRACGPLLLSSRELHRVVIDSVFLPFSSHRWYFSRCLPKVLYTSSCCVAGPASQSLLARLRVALTPPPPSVSLHFTPFAFTSFSSLFFFLLLASQGFLTLSTFSLTRSLLSESISWCIRCIHVFWVVVLGFLLLHCFRWFSIHFPSPPLSPLSLFSSLRHTHTHARTYTSSLPNR